MGNAQSRREAREARRNKSVRKWVALGGAGIILLSGGIIALNLSNGDENKGSQAIPDNCTSTQRVSVETSSTMAETLKNIPVSSENCIILTITSATSTLDTANQIISGKSAPNLWIPDSSTRAELALAGKAKVVTKSDSLAKTPAVIVTTNDSKEDTWLAAVNNADSIKMGEPKTNSGSFMALLNSTAETENDKVAQKELSVAVGKRAQTIGVDSPAPTSSELLDQTNNGDINAAVVTESEYTLFKKDHSDNNLHAYAPGDNSGMLDYPLYQPASGNDTNQTVSDAAEMIKNYLASDDGKKALADNGLRNSNGDELAENSVGAVAALTGENTKDVGNMWASYLRQSAPLNALIAVDVSGSMGSKVTGSDRTRMDITKESILAGSELFPPRDSLGLWSFALNIAQDIQGNKTDYKELVPIRPLPQETDGKTQLELLREAGESLQPYPDSYTGLNDTTMAAFDTMKANYETGSANVVVIMTDGENTDSTSISTDELIKTIQSQQDPDNPVYFLFIGISEDANMDSLKHLASQTGGQAFNANSSDEIQKIFQNALSFSEDTDAQSAQK